MCVVHKVIELHKPPFLKSGMIAASAVPGGASPNTEALQIRTYHTQLPKSGKKVQHMTDNILIQRFSFIFNRSNEERGGGKSTEVTENKKQFQTQEKHQLHGALCFQCDSPGVR